MKTVTIYFAGNSVQLELDPSGITDLQNAMATQNWFYATGPNGESYQISGAYITGFAAL